MRSTGSATFVARLTSIIETWFSCVVSPGARRLSGTAPTIALASAALSPAKSRRSAPAQMASTTSFSFASKCRAIAFASPSGICVATKMRSAQIAALRRLRGASAMPRFLRSPELNVTAPARPAAFATAGTAFRIRPYCATVLRSAEASMREADGGILALATSGATLAGGFLCVSRSACATATPPCPSSAAWWILA